MAWLADRYHSKRSFILGIALFVWSVSCILSGFSSEYWQVAVCRFILALAESACTPLAGSLISDYFPKETRATALGIYNWGIYTGFSLAQGAANLMTHCVSWRVVWWVFGCAGVCWVPFVMSIKSNTGIHKMSGRMNLNAAGNSKKRSNVSNRISINASSDSADDAARSDISGRDGKKSSTMKILAYFFGTPSIILLFVASLIRNAGGYVWAYNATQFFENVKGQSSVEIAEFMQWIPLIGGSLGAVLGGFVLYLHFLCFCLYSFVCFFFCNVFGCFAFLILFKIVFVNKSFLFEMN